MPFIGNQPALSYTSFAKQDFTTSATTSYTLDNPVTNENELALFINFVRQEPTTAYTASGTTLTLTSATSASDDMYCVFLGKAVQTVNPPNGSVGASQISDGSIALGKLSATGTKDATTFLRGDNTFAAAGGGKVLQVVFGSTSTETRNNTNTLADTGLSASITPSATNSKVLIIVMQNGCDKTNANAGNQMILKLLRGSTQISTLTNNGGYSNSSIPLSFGTVGGCLLDEPSSTSELTYKTQFSCGNNTAGVGVQGTGGENSHITLMEIGA